MDSPVNIPFRSFIKLDADSDTALYLQLAFGFIKGIQTGLLPEGTRLPGSRVLCKVLQVNRNTLIRALDDLEAQGFIKVFPNKGTYVLSDQRQKIRHRVENEKANHQSAPIHFDRSSLLDNPEEVSDLPHQFDDGQPDPRLTHSDVLARLYLAQLKRGRVSNGLAASRLSAESELNRECCNFLNMTRGVRIAEDQLLLTGSPEISLYLVARLFAGPGDKIAVASPGYYRAHMTLADTGASLLTVPVDEEGLVTSALERICQNQTIRMVYLVPANHYPTTGTLSAKRRIELLELARKYQFIILEAESDYEFHFDNNTVLPLAALDNQGSIIYIGSLSRSLSPGFAYGFITARPEIIRELTKRQSIIEPPRDAIKEQVITQWIRDGEIHRLIKKNRLIYRERRDYFISLLRQYLGDYISFEIPARGLAVWINWQAPINLMRLREECSKQGLFLPKTLLYQNKGMCACRLGFGRMGSEEMEEVLKRLAEGMRDVLVIKE